MKIALVLLPMWTIEAPPLGIASLSAVLKKEGHDVHSFDLNLAIYKQINPQLWDLTKARGWASQTEFREKILPNFSEFLTNFAQKLVSEGYEAVGFTTYQCNYFTVSWFATLLKFLKPEIKIAIGGPEVLHHEFHRLANFQIQGVIDAAVMGEGESSAVGLFRAWEKGESIAGIPGVIVESEGKLDFVGRPKSLDVNGLAHPDFSDFDLKSYKKGFLPVQFSRGCSANCSFCNENTYYWPVFQMKTPEVILDQVQHLAERYDCRDFWAADSLLNGNHVKLAGFVDLVLARKFEFLWGGNMRIDKRLRAPLNFKLREAGFHSVTFGVESGSNSILKAMNKGITREDAVTVLKWMKEAEIKVEINLIVGFPGETAKDFEDTLRLIDEAGDAIDSANTMIFCVDLKTAVGQNLKKFGIKTDSEGQVIKDERSTYLGNSWFSETGDSDPDIRLERLYRLRKHIETFSPRANINRHFNG